MSRVSVTGGSSPPAGAPLLDLQELRGYVASYVERGQSFLQLARDHGSPAYVFEPNILRARAKEFVRTFSAAVPDLGVFYAVKCNSHPDVMATVTAEGLGLDVSSGRELESALALDGDFPIVFSGPGKTSPELALALQHARRVTVLLDSPSELARLQNLAAADDREIRTGVRLTTDERGLWRKFGIPLADLTAFVAEATRSTHIRLRGLQFHSSWNLDPSRQVAFLQRIGSTIAQLPAEQRALLEFIDIGGGFWPPRGEWIHSPDGAARRPADLRHYRQPAAPLETFAVEIACALREAIFPHLDCRICVEPGRWLCHDAMHILLTVVDKKAADLVIVDAGTNTVGWERFESDYFPMINLTRPGLTEQACDVLGSLCTPHDVWGYSYFGDGIEPGDVLLIPSQGAYTYSLRQDFIKPAAPVVRLS